MEIGQGYPRVLRQLQQDYECWMIAPFEQTSLPPGAQHLLQERLITGKFETGNTAIPVDTFDCVFSVAVLGQLPNNPDVFENALCTINQALAPGGYSLHCVNVILKPDRISLNGALSYFGTHADPLHEFVSFDTLRNDPDLFTLSEQFYKAHWQAKTKQPYKRFGKPTVCNVLWQKA